MKIVGRSRRSRNAKIAGAVLGGTVGLVAFGYGPELKHAVEAGERAARVVTALTLCIRE